METSLCVYREKWQQELVNFEHRCKMFSEERGRFLGELETLRRENSNLHMELRQLKSGRDHSDLDRIEKLQSESSRPENR
jgi:hypothetical protein